MPRRVARSLEELMTNEELNVAAAPVPEGEDALEVPPVEAPAESPNTAGIPMSAFSLAPEQYWGIDLSFHTVTEAQAQLVYDAGVRVAFQCLWTGVEAPRPREDNIRRLAAVGIIVCGYVSTSAGRTGLAHVQAGYDSLANDVQRMLVLVAVDHELLGYTFAVVKDAVDALRNRGYPSLVYTSYNAWVNIFANPTMPKDWLVWNAFWDNDADYDFERYPYGGVTIDRIIGEQYTGAEWVEGINADRSLFQARFFHAAVPDPQPVPEAPYVVHITETFSDGTKWELDVVPPPGVR